MELFKLLGTVAIDNANANQAIQDTTDIAKESESKLSSVFANIGSFAVKCGKALAAGLAAGTAAIAGLAKSSLDSYGEYEQLVGGVETLFKDSSDKVLEYADNAYKTAGMSANEYMSTVTSFSASLLQSLASTTSKLGEAAIKASEEALEAQYESVEDANKKQEKLLKEAQENELEAFEKLTDEKISLIDKQYKENLKLIDKEEYDRVKAIDAQIDALNEQTEAERDAIKQREQEQKKAALQEKILTAESDEARLKAEEELAEYLADLAQEERESQRKEQIAALKEQKEVIKEEADSKREILKEQYDTELEAAKTASEAQLKEMKKAQENELEALKESNEKKLEATEEYIEQQIALLKSSSSVAVYTAETYEQAADKANQAVIDMADNANKMGTPLESIQNAYQGFAKQNFTMLDNLKLGYGGTKEEMERLLADAEKMGGLAEGTFDINSFGDIVDAIHIVQEEMGITGTTAKEAGSTIQGSLGSVSAAWTNLITGIGDENKDLSVLINNLVTSATGAIGNIIPILEKILGGIGEVIVALMPIIAAELPGLIESLLPAVLQGATALVIGLVAALPELVSILIKCVPVVIKQIGASLEASFPTLFKRIEKVFTKYIKPIFESIIEPIENVFSLLTEKSESASESFQPLSDMIGTFVDEYLNYLIEGFETLTEIWTTIFVPTINTIIDIFMTLATTIIEAIIPPIVQIGDVFLNMRDVLISVINEHILPLIQGFVAMIQELWAENQDKVTKIGELFKTVFETIAGIFTWFNDYVIKGALIPAIEFISTTVQDNMDTVKSIFQGVFDAIGGIIDIFISLFKNDWDGLWAGVIEVLSGTFDTIKGIFSLAWEGIKGIFAPVGEFFGGVWEGIKGAFGSVTTWFSDTFSAAWQAVLDVFNAGGVIFEGITEAISDVFVDVVNFLIGGINEVIALPFNTINGLLNDIRGISILGAEPFKDLWDKNPLEVPEIPELREGGVLEKGQVGLLEGDGAEAVVPLHNNKKWISKVADDFKGEIGNSETVINKLDELIKAILGLKIYMNGDVLVGELAPAMDSSLGNMYAMKGRGQ